MPALIGELERVERVSGSNPVRSVTAGGSPLPWPVLLTTASSRPYALRVASTSAPRSSGSSTEPCRPIPPSSSARRTLRSESDISATRYPAAAKLRAMPAPIPCPEAVTMATCADMTILPSTDSRASGS